MSNSTNSTLDVFDIIWFSSTTNNTSSAIDIIIIDDSNNNHNDSFFWPDVSDEESPIQLKQFWFTFRLGLIVSAGMSHVGLKAISEPSICRVSTGKEF